MAEPVYSVGELAGHIRIERHIVVRKSIDVGAHATRELLEHHMLILHLIGELRRLENLGAVPLDCKSGGELILLLDQVFNLRDKAIVLPVKYFVYGRERDILIGTRIARNVVRIQKLIVVRCPRSARRIDEVVCVRELAPRGIGAVGDIRQERLAVPGPLRELIGIGCGNWHRDIEHVSVRQDNPAQGSIGLDVGPGCHPTIGVRHQPARKHTVRIYLLKVEHCSRRRTVGLALINQRPRCVYVDAEVTRLTRHEPWRSDNGGTRHHHHIRNTRNITWAARINI